MKYKKYFVVAIETDDEQEAIKKAWEIRARFVFDVERGQFATIVTDHSGSRLITYAERERADVG